ncbi:MAG: tetratricopeptide repeat protein [Pseudohongiellaceae bacterium]|nr:tetratricopeptide repeat protein [Pseudohongiellaceae bacterium]
MMTKDVKAVLKQLFLIAIGAGVTFSTIAAQAQSGSTATRIESSGNTSSVKVIQFEEPEEFINIRRLLSNGSVDEALELAKSYVENVEKNTRDLPSRYFAYNALCVAYTHARESAKAEEECTRAVELIPSHWSAWNNRGTARYLAGNMAGAKQDYEKALDQAGNKKDVKELLEHNISLVDQQNQ